jgi:hypothetical protein
VQAENLCQKISVFRLDTNIVHAMIEYAMSRQIITLFLLALLVPILSVICCLGPSESIEINLEPGKIIQRSLIEENFSIVNSKTDAEALKLFREGKRTSVSAAWWGFNPDDSTTSVQEALDSGAPVVLIPALGAPWVVRELFVRSNTLLIIEEGAVITAKKGAFAEPSQTLLNLLDVENVKIYGYGATIRMRKEDYASPAYKKGEWRHTIQICGGKRVVIAGLCAEKSGGDGVYLGRGSRQKTNSDIHLKDLLLREHYRQGISVITAENLLIENVEMAATSGTMPSAGIDFEPNMPDEDILACSLKNCIIRNNGGAGFQCYFMCHNMQSHLFEISLDGCTIYGNLVALFVIGFENGARGKIRFANNRIYGLQLISDAPDQLAVEWR